MFQESVGATAARAHSWLTDEFIEKKMWARPVVVLYDSVVTLCPIEERFEVAKAHDLNMVELNCWNDHGRTWNYPIDTELNQAWSWSPAEDVKTRLNDKTWSSDPSGLPSCDAVYIPIKLKTKKQHNE